MNILGISAFYHDSAACLVQDGKIVSAVQEERFTRQKHDASFPKNAINYCLHNSGLKEKDLDFVVFYDKPLLKFERLQETYLAYAPVGIWSFMEAIPRWIKEKLWMNELISEELNFEGKILFAEHHQSHAASAFFPSPFHEAAFLTMDGVGEWATASFGVGKENDIQIQAETYFPHSLGLLYSAFTYYTGFKVNSDEYKVMGLAPYGEPKYKDLILSELMDLKEDGSFKLNMKYFNYCAGLTMTNKRFAKLLGGLPRKQGSVITHRDMDLARSIQEVTEDVMLRMARHVHKETGCKNLCLAGGVALNCVGNGRILREGPFENIWIQPAAGDAGGALGAALFVWYQYLGNKRSTDGKADFMQGAYLGPEFDNSYVAEYLIKNNISHTELSNEKVPGEIAELIAAQNVVGWFQGRMEFGPRALGNRSILGDARSPEMQETMNLKIKFRESFRPFAPSVLRERMSDYFELDKESPYMLVVTPVRKEICKESSDSEKNVSGLDKLRVMRSSIPAVTHVDYSARPQTVNKRDNPLFYELIAKFDEKYGCPVVVNTSFNIQGEPIVCTPEDAYQCFMRTDMDYLIMGNFLLEKKKQKLFDEDIELGNNYAVEQDKDIEIGRSDLRKFGITLGGVLGLWGGLFFWRGRAYYPSFLIISGIFLFLGFLFPTRLIPIYRGWMRLTAFSGWLITRVVLGALFYLVFAPIGLLGRLCGKDFLNLKFNRHAGSYWIPKARTEFEKGRYERQF